MDSKRIGNIGEVKVLAKFIELGYAVYLPFGDDEKADLVVDFGGKLQKIQVKTTNTLQDGYYTIDFRNCKNHVCCPKPRQNYTADQIDYFATYCVERDTICLFKIQKMPNTTIRLRYEPAKNGQNAGVRWEKDYLIENVLKQYQMED